MFGSSNTGPSDSPNPSETKEEKKQTRSPTPSEKKEDKKQTHPSDSEKKEARSDSEKKEARSDSEKKEARSDSEKKEARSDSEKKEARSDSEKKDKKQDQKDKKEKLEKKDKSEKKDDKKPSRRSFQSIPVHPTIDTKIDKPTPSSDIPKRKISKARELIASARNSLTSLNPTSSSNTERSFRVIRDNDSPEPPPGANNNSAGDSKPGPRTTFRVGVTEDKNRKCRRTMEDTHSYVYNFLPVQGAHESPDRSSTSFVSEDLADSDNGYFAIFDGHAGTYAADWCGRKLHVILEETIRKNPNTPVPELLDMTFTNCDGQLEKLPVKNSGCTAVCAVLRWEDRPVSALSPADSNENAKLNATPSPRTERQRMLYTANVGDARIVLCRNGKALRLSYDHKGSDENEGKRVANAGGLILNNRVNGVLAVTRALGDSYMKDLVTGHPYTTESVVQNDIDEFIILACDGLWDVCTDQDAVDLVRNIKDPKEASKRLVEHALSQFSSDNLSCMIVRLDPTGKFEGLEEKSASLNGEAKVEARKATK